MNKKSVEKKSLGKKALKKFKNFLGYGLKTEQVKCPYCKDVFNSLRDWGLHIKEVHCH
jgi:hypothetical protein